MVLATAVACRGDAPDRLVPLADPFVYNGPAAIRLPVRALTAEGVSVTLPMEATSETPAIAEVSGGGVRCLRAGDAEIRVRAGTLRTSFVMQCRPVDSFGPPFSLEELEVGGDPVPIALTAFDSSGRRVDDLRFHASTRDTAIVALRSGLVVPRRMGTATIRLDFGGLERATHVEVVAPVRRDTIRWAAGEYRQWTLGPGRYRARLETAAGEGAAAIAWGSANANCAVDPWSPATLHCVIADRGTLVAVARAPARATVRIDRRVR